MTRARSLVGLATLLAACGRAPAASSPVASTSGSSSSSSSPSSSNDDRALASAPKHPTPYTAEQIRAATKAGRMYRYKVEFPGKPPFEREVTFVSVDADGATIASTGEPNKRVTWEELRKHAEFPEPIVRTREETVTVPAGTFDCVVYVVLGEGGEATSFYFAKTMPGAPVQYFTNIEGRRVMTSTLVEHHPGK